jgi:uracil-DNA glycosylase
VTDRAGSSRIDVDLPSTRRRIAALERYVSDRLLHDDRFTCGHFDDCRLSCDPDRIFREGGMSHVGGRFDLRIDGRPLRVVVVGQESGWIKDTESNQTGRRVTLAQRRADIAEGSGLNCRYYAHDGYPAGNPHMRGTTSALPVIFGGAPGEDFKGEWVAPASGRAFHLFDGFALVNLLLCSASPAGALSQGASTRRMRANCREHFKATLAMLEPTLVVVQGRLAADNTTAVLRRTTVTSNHLYESELAGAPVLVAVFSHPSARGDARWGDRLDGALHHRRGHPHVAPGDQPALTPPSSGTTRHLRRSGPAAGDSRFAARCGL